ncbi:MAG: ABC transporter ATP-binding protein [Nitrososphaerota archaeon]|nr:ABC transporter ATP-binding protein [Nitrososphaerota archaeon]
MKSKRESLLAGFRIRFGIIIASFVLLSGVEGVFQPLLVKSIFDQGVVKGNLHRFIVLAVIYLVLGLSINGLTFLVSLKAKLLENRICIEVSSRMLQAFYKSNYSDILKRGEGYYISRIRDDVQIGLIPRLRLIISVSSQTALVLGSSAVLIILSWQAFMVLLVVAPLTVVLANLLSKKIQMITTDQREQTGKLLSTLTKALSAFRIVNTFGMVSQTVDTVNAELAQALHLDFRSTRLLSLFQAANDVTMVTSDFISLFVGAVFVIRGKLSFGGYLAFVNSFWRAITSLDFQENVSG